MWLSILGDFQDSLWNAISSSSPILLVMVALIAVFAGLRMSNIGGIFGWTFEGAMILLGTLYFWNWMSDPGRFTYDGWSGSTMESWKNLIGLTIYEVIGYLTLFFLAILAVYLVRSFARR